MRPDTFQGIEVRVEVACVQASPISFVARGKDPFSASNKGNRRDICTQASVEAYAEKNAKKNAKRRGEVVFERSFSPAFWRVQHK